jgi:hypothetical protein
MLTDNGYEIDAVLTKTHQIKGTARLILNRKWNPHRAMLAPSP